MPQTDEQLIELCKEDDISALEELLARYRNPLMGFIYSVIRDYHQAQDIFQETFIRVYRQARGFRTGAVFKTWLYTIAMNRCRDAIRKSKRRPIISLEASRIFQDGEPGQRMMDRIASSDPGPRTIAGVRELEVIFQRELAGLSEEHREVVILNRLNGLKYREIAEVLNIPSGTVRSRLHYALEELRKRMKA
ncbi:MAG: RNA polymerase sigma factor [Candidatus Auribacterota bacterium]|nr:RNA polymerase sigma factor [Candidatus Auribacterota bacterium]